MNRETPLRRVTPLKSKTPPKRKGSVGSDFSRPVKDLVLRRSGGRCEARTPVCTEHAVHFHHRILRSKGGRGTIDNCLHVCAACHTWIHGHPKVSYEQGWMIRAAGSGRSSD